MSLDKIDTLDDPKLERVSRHIHENALSNVLTETEPVASTVPYGRLVVFDDGTTQALYIKTGQNRLLRVGLGTDPGDGGTVITYSNVLIDEDQDTKIQVEEGTDDDTIRFDCAGTEQFIIQDGAVLPTVTNDVGLGSSGKVWKTAYATDVHATDVHVAGQIEFTSAENYVKYNAASGYMEHYVGGNLRIEY